MRLAPGTMTEIKRPPPRATPPTGRDAWRILTCPVFFKAVQEVESHHDEGVQGNESYVHLKREGNADAIVAGTFRPCSLPGRGAQIPH